MQVGMICRLMRYLSPIGMVNKLNHLSCFAAYPYNMSDMHKGCGFMFRVPDETVRRFDAAMDAARIGMQEAAASRAALPVAGYEKRIATPCMARMTNDEHHPLAT